MTRLCAAPLFALPLVLAATAPVPARAHGLFGHVHVTGYAIENLPPGELRQFFQEPGLLTVALMGATFPDTGYALGDATTRAYGEAAHWEPYIHPLIEHVRTTYGPTYDTPEERKVVAFVMGMASHGMQDELFDTTFDLEVRQHDPDSDFDTNLDGLFAFDEHARLYPNDDFVPFPDLLSVYDASGIAITEPIIQHQIDIVLGVYVNDGFGLNVAIQNGLKNYQTLPWAYTHYLDPAVPGSFAAEVHPTSAYLQAIWDRLHGRFVDDDLVVHGWPEAPRRLRSADHTQVASYVTVVFGMGVDFQTVTASLADEFGTPHPFTLANQRWNSRITRLVQLRPTVDYVPGRTYVARIEAGATRVDGVASGVHEIPFQVDCAPPDASVCPPLGVLDDPILDGSGFPDPVAPADTGGCSLTASGSAPAAPLAALGFALAVGSWRSLRRRRERREGEA